MNDTTLSKESIERRVFCQLISCRMKLLKNVHVIYEGSIFYAYAYVRLIRYENSWPQPGRAVLRVSGEDQVSRDSHALQGRENFADGSIEGFRGNGNILHRRSWLRYRCSISGMGKTPGTLRCPRLNTWRAVARNYTRHRLPRLRLGPGFF